MRALILVLALIVIAPAMAQQSSASEQLKEKFLAILRGEIAQQMNAAAQQAAMPPTAAEISAQIDGIMVEATKAYGPFLILPETEANRLLTIGPDDKANMAAMQRDIELWKKVQRPMPVLYKQMQEQVAAGKIKGGLELELTRRISEFHLHQLGML